MLQKEYVFYGKHAEYVKRLTSKVIIDTNISILNRNVDVLLLGSIIGLVYGRKASVDRNGKDGSNTKIFAETMIKESQNISYNYELIMMINNKETEDIELRLDKAFRYVNKSEDFKIECKKIFTEYILGGVEVLYEKIIGNSSTTEEYISNLYEFIDDFNIKFNVLKDDVDLMAIYELSGR